MKKLHASGEDYLEAVLVLQKEKGMVRSVDVSRHLDVSKPSVCHAVATLKEGGFLTMDEDSFLHLTVPFPVSWTVKMKKKQKETQDILSYHTQAAGCSDKARAKASGGRQPIEECGRTGL